MMTFVLTNQTTGDELQITVPDPDEEGVLVAVDASDVEFKVRKAQRVLTAEEKFRESQWEPADGSGY